MPIDRQTITPLRADRPAMPRVVPDPKGVPASWLRALIIPLIILVWLALAVVVAWLAGHVIQAILVVVLSIVLAFAFTPLANLLARWLPRGIAIALAYVAGIGILFGFLAFIILTVANQVSALVSDLPAYAQQLQAMAPELDGLLGRVGMSGVTVGSLQQQALGQLQGLGTSIASDLVSRVTQVAGLLVDAILVLILSVYFAANGQGVSHWLQTETPSGSIRYRAQLLVGITSRVVGGYIRGVLALAALVGLFVGAGLWVLGVPYAVLLGVLAFFMEFVPVLGVFVSGAASLVVALLHYHDLIHPLIVLGYFAIVHVLEGDVVGPRIMGKAVGIHPATGLIALVAGMELFGIWGALFAAPLAGLAQALITAAWLEFRGGDAQTVLAAVTEVADEKAEEEAAATVG